MVNNREGLETTCRNVHPVEVIMMGDIPVEIDEELVPLVQALWDRGYETLLSCQNLGEAIEGGGTEFSGTNQERAELASRTRHLTWLIVRNGQEAHLMQELDQLVRAAGGWYSQPSDVPGWASICIPRQQIAEARALLSQ